VPGDPGKRPSLVRIPVRSTIVLDPLSGAMVNGRAWFASVLDPHWGRHSNGRHSLKISIRIWVGFFTRAR